MFKVQIYLYLPNPTLTCSPSLSVVKTKLLNLVCKALGDLALPTSPAPTHTNLCPTFFTPTTWLSFNSLYVRWSLLHWALPLLQPLPGCLHAGTTSSSITSSVIREAFADFPNQGKLPLVKVPPQVPLPHSI